MEDNSTNPSEDARADQKLKYVGKSRNKLKRIRLAVPAANDLNDANQHSYISLAGPLSNAPTQSGLLSILEAGQFYFCKKDQALSYQALHTMILMSPENVVTNRVYNPPMYSDGNVA